MSVLRRNLSLVPALGDGPPRPGAMLYFLPMSGETNAPAARHNFRLGVLNGLLFTVAETLMDPTLVLVAFISHLTRSPFWLGLVVPLRDGSWYLPQLWVSGYLQSQPRKFPLYRRMVALRIVVWLLLVVAVFTVRAPGMLLVVFFVTWGMYAVAAGLGGLSFLEIVSKTIPPQRRGAFFATRLTLGGIAAIGASALVRWLLDDAGPLPFPYNFGVLFALSWAVGTLGLIAFSRVLEPPDRTVHPRASLLAQIRRAGQILSADRNYRHFLFLRTALLVAGVATPFFAVYVEQRLGGSLAMVGVYLAVFMISSLGSNILLGKVSARLGNRRTLAIAGGAGLLMTSLVLALMRLASPFHWSGSVASLWLVPIFALSGIRESALGVAGQSLLLDISPPSQRTLYFGFTNSLLGCVLLATGVSGLVVARLGVGTLVVCALVANLFALNSALRMRDVLHAPLPDSDLSHPLTEAHPAP